MLNKNIFVKQSSSRDCASACLLSIMKYYGTNASIDEVSYILKTTMSGTNALNIINGCKSFGFDGYGIHYSYDEIINNKINMPIICHVLKNNMFHFIVVFESNKKELIINDPSSNINRISHEFFKKIYLKTSIVIYPVKIIKSHNNISSLKAFIFDYIRLEKKTIIKTIIISFIVTIFGIVSNYYLMIILDKILPQNKYNMLIIITLIFLNIYIIKNIMFYIRSIFINDIEASIYKKINLNIIKSIFNLPYSFFKSKSTSEVLTRIDDLKIFKSFISKIIITLGMDIPFILLSSFILILISSKLFLISLIEVIIYFFIYLFFKDKITIKNEEVLESESIYNKSLYESINGYEINKNLNIIDNQNKKNEINLIKHINRIKDYEKLYNKQVLIKSLIVDISYVISVYIGINLIINDSLSLGNFILFNSLLLYFSEPIKNIIDLLNNVIYLKNTYRRINDLILFRKVKPIIKKNNLIGDITINNLSYSINGIDYIFNNVSFNIKYGKPFLIYGQSGVGKSTIMKVLLKYLDDYKGEIFINKTNLKDINDYVISDNWTYISQNSYLNNDTLINNIICNRNISDVDYEKILNICNLIEFRNSKKSRNDFIIEDDGFNISGGERQKIILARSLLKNSNYIIIDEALSEVGVDEEKEIINKIINNYKEKTIIYISHKKEIINLFSDKYELERSSG